MNKKEAKARKRRGMDFIQGIVSPEPPPGAPRKERHASKRLRRIAGAMWRAEVNLSTKRKP